MKSFLFIFVSLVISIFAYAETTCDVQNAYSYENCIINNISTLMLEKKYGYALDMLNSYEEWFKSQKVRDEKSLARISAGRATILYMMGDYERSLSEYQNVQKIYSKLSEEKLFVEMQVNISVVLASLNKYDEAKKEISLAEKFYKERKMPVDLADVSFTRGIFYYLSGDLKDALIMLSNADELYLKTGMKIRYLTTQILKGIVKTKLGDYRDALYMCENNHLSFSLKYYCVALANDGLNRPEEAKRAYEIALSKIDKNIKSVISGSGEQTAQAISEKYASVFTDYLIFLMKSAIKLKDQNLY